MNNMLKYALVFSLAVLIPLVLSAWIMPKFVVLVLIATLLAYVLSPLVKWAEGRVCSRSLSSFIFTFVIPTVVLEWLITVIPTIFNSLQILIINFPQAYDHKIAPYLNQHTGLTLDWAWLSAHIPYDKMEVLQFQLFGNIFEFIMYALLFIIIAFILLRDWEEIVLEIRQLLHDTTPDRWNPEIDNLFNQIGHAISRLIRGQLEVSTILAVYYGIAFHLIALLAEGELHFVSAWMFVGILTGYLNLLPYIGVPLGGVLASLLGIMSFQLEALWIYAAIFLIVGIGVTVDHKLLTPRIIGRSVKVHEIFVYFAVYLGAALGGVVGVLLALPAMTVVSVCGRYFYHHWLTHRDEERKQYQVYPKIPSKG